MGVLTTYLGPSKGLRTHTTRAYPVLLEPVLPRLTHTSLPRFTSPLKPPIHCDYPPDLGQALLIRGHIAALFISHL